MIGRARPATSNPFTILSVVEGGVVPPATAFTAAIAGIVTARPGNTAPNLPVAPVGSEVTTISGASDMPFAVCWIVSTLAGGV